MNFGNINETPGNLLFQVGLSTVGFSTGIIPSNMMNTPGTMNFPLND